jgi:hypothetical protein
MEGVGGAQAKRLCRARSAEPAWTCEPCGPRTGAGVVQQVDGNVEPFRVALEMLNGIPGVSSLSAEVIIAEIGVVMSRFETAGHLIAWAGLCPPQR